MACDTKNSLIRDGVSQQQRLVPALMPTYAQVDERSMEDLLLFLVNYAKELSYVDSFNNPSGSWKELVEKDITVTIALIAKKNAQIEKDVFNQLIENITEQPATEVHIQRSFKTLFDLFFTIIAEFNEWYKATAKGLGIQSYLKRIIRSQIRPEMERLIGYYKGALTIPALFEANMEQSIPRKNLDLLDAHLLLKKGFEPAWFESDVMHSIHDNWADYYANIPANETIYGPKKTSPSAKASLKIKASLETFKQSFQSIHGTMLQVIQKAPVYVEETLQKHAEHEPHIGLLLSFLGLFKHAQTHINGITKRHLDFYYEQVLQMSRLDAVPDKVHLVYELAKHIDSHKLQAETLLKAGKDALGNEVLYKTNKEAVFNKATVASLKSIFVENASKLQRVYASPVANSLDGNGSEFEEEHPKWKAFGESQAGLSKRTMPDANIGFAISSPNLLLSEGDRHIILQLECVDKIPSSGNIISTSIPDVLEEFIDENYLFAKTEIVHDLSDLIHFSLTGEEDWITSENNGNVSFLAFSINAMLFIYIGLESGLPAISNYALAVHGLGYDTTHPIIKLTANPNSTNNYLNNVFNNTQIKAIKLEVIANNIKNLSIQNDNGSLDPSKPFQPFTAQAKLGAQFYIGSNEIFKKNLHKLELAINWHNLPDNKQTFDAYYNYQVLPNKTKPHFTYNPRNTSFKAIIHILNNNDWTNLSPGNEFELFDETNYNAQRIIKLPNSQLSIGAHPNLDPFKQYTIGMSRGFIRLTLSAPENAFGHKIYAPLLTKQLVKQDDNIPVEPYTPEIKNISLNFASSEDIALTSASDLHNRDSKFFHIHPFGTREISEKTTESPYYILPQFTFNKAGTLTKHQGMFLIGLKDLTPPQNVSILFKLAEGSADPALNKQDITWYYLDHDNWTKFEAHELISDSSNGLLTTGIVQFAIPRNASNANNILASGLHWIMATVPKNTSAICELMELHTQAGLASFKNNNNAPNFLASPTPANTISKLKVNETQVKSISQPYASFGGKEKETDNEFYQRISERLRHKSRSISIWDYEHMILQQFPDVYKVKCINHSTYDAKRTDDARFDSEFAPGYVTIIVVPRLHNQNAVDQLKPRISLHSLETIKHYISRYISAFAAAKIKVINPCFEEIQVQFYAEFHRSFDRGYYEKQLTQDIISFLSPWAFESGKDIVFGGKIHRSLILNFIEERPYIDYVSDFEMNHIIDEANTNYNVEEAYASTARSILVSSNNHILLTSSSCS